MTQASRPQADHTINFPAPSDPGPYSADLWAQYMQIVYTGDQQAVQGPLIRYLNELVVANNGSTQVTVGTGAGFVNGRLLVSSELETWTIPAGPAGGRTDRVVMVENNSNVEITQTTAARPLLFPADLSEYTATPGVPAYSARLAIIRGNDAGALPALDQTTALYMVELYRYDINAVPTISTATDYRDFCEFSTEVDPAMIKNRTRQFFVQAQAGWDITGAGDVPMATMTGRNMPVILMADAVQTNAFGSTMVPKDYVSGMTIKPVFFTIVAVAGNIYLNDFAEAGECGQVYNTHNSTSGFAAAAITNDQWFRQCTATLSVAGIGTDDILNLECQRDATDVLDTYNNDIGLLGWVVSYTADS